ncbi:Mlp family lipoprotein [Borrelia puertoricensis]|uniref:Mlp family lipoprotein n=1 Tax=Borrelia puertoricensis TaxID=2756107 RepID=UPI001FF33A16|nr:Mlp family lipoprotein [Borrelia puertoricensis]UPA18527.1 Mlp family lipoprotein [Borrelia puertoricensis]
MKKFLTLVFTNIFFMYSCNGPKTDASLHGTKLHERNEHERNEHERNEADQIKITNDQMYNLLKRITKDTHKDVHYTVRNKLIEFFTWIESNPQKQKEIINAIAPIYDFLDKKRQKLASHMTFEEYIIDGASRLAYDNYNNQYGPHIDDDSYNNYNNYVSKLFNEIGAPILNLSKTNEETFEKVKKLLSEGRTDKYPHELLKGWD